MDIRKVETGEIKKGTVIKVIWDILDNGYQVTRLGEVVETELSFGDFMIELRGGGKVRINKESTLWKKF